jgi:mannose-6-phosphate isomerase-like protein (cupin superfamily)
MQRRSFLQLPLVASALAALDLTDAEANVPADGYVLVRAGESRHTPLRILDSEYFVIVSTADSKGQCVLFDTIRNGPSGPALHLHTDVDEWFYIVTGTFKFQAGSETLRLGPGDSLFIPRNMAHAFVKTSEGKARLLVMHQPAGTMEAFFEQTSQLPNQSLENRRVIAEKHGMKILGPSLKPD